MTLFNLISFFKTMDDCFLISVEFSGYSIFGPCYLKDLQYILSNLPAFSACKDFSVISVVFSCDSGSCEELPSTLCVVKVSMPED